MTRISPIKSANLCVFRVILQTLSAFKALNSFTFTLPDLKSPLSFFHLLPIFNKLTLILFGDGIEKKMITKGIITMQKSSRWLVLVLLVVVGAALRVLYLGKAAPWLDEAITYDRALSSVTDIIKASYGWDIHPPTYYVIAHYMLNFGHSAEALRLFSVICGVLCIPVFYAFAREVLGREREALVATLLLTFSAYQIRYAQEARMYTLFFLVSLLALWFFYRAVQRQQKSDWYLWAGLSMVNFYVHYFSIFLMAGQVVFYLVHLIRAKTLPQLFKQHRVFVWATLILFVGCLPAVPLLVQQASAKISSYGVKQPTVNPLMYLLVFLKFSFYPNTIANPLWERGLKYIFAVVIFFGSLIAWKERKTVIIFSGTLLVVALSLAWVASHVVFFSLTFRYLYFLNAPVLILLALAITAVADKVWQRRKALALVTVLGAVVVLQVYILAHYYQNPRNADWRAGFALLKQNCRAEDAIIPVPAYVSYVARYYLVGDKNHARVFWEHNTTPAGLDTLLERHKGLFVVVTDDMYPPESRQKVNDWLAANGRLLWEDPNFPGNVIWYAQKASPLGMKTLENESN